MSDDADTEAAQEPRNTLYRKVSGGNRRLTRGRMFVYRVAVVVAWFLVRLFWATCRVQRTPGIERARAAVRESRSVIPVYWHQHMLFGVRALLDLRDDGLKVGFLISPSVDGTAPAMLVGRSRRPRDPRLVHPHRRARPARLLRDDREAGSLARPHARRPARPRCTSSSPARSCWPS